MWKHLLYLIIAIPALFACQNAQHVNNSQEGDTLKLKYAENLTIVKRGRATVVTLVDPWDKTRQLAKYVLVKRTDSANVGSLPEGNVIYTPVRQCIVSTSPHARLFHDLGAMEYVKGVCDSRYMNIPAVRSGIANGSIVDCGNAMSPSIERIAAVSPQAIFISPMDNGDYGKMAKIGVPLIFCAEYMERSALARAEWMKFYGMLFDCYERSASIFRSVDSTYMALRKKASESKVVKSVFTERKTGDVWYCPGGESSMGALLKDANCKYVFGSDKSSGSLPLSAETVISKAANADIWLFVYNGSKQVSRSELLSEYKGYALLKAFKKGDIYECNAMSRPYFEEISFYPDRLLADLVQILHPDIKMPGGLRYYERLNP